MFPLNKKTNNSYQEKEGSEGEAKQQWTSQICIVHDVAVHRPKRVENGEGLCFDVAKVDAELYDATYSRFPF